ncbi:MAG: DUF4007 family protein [Truepera sp.]|nr:DUF4007 family protein [Truepera sp.]
MLVELRFDNVSYSFSGHETFPLRYAWLSKAVQHLQSSPESILARWDDGSSALLDGWFLTKPVLEGTCFADQQCITLAAF